MIPKIIHLIWWQGYMNIPNKFIKNIDSWKHHNPNYKIIIWDNKSITKFIKKIYPKNYIILNRYFKMIQKIDFSKYLILYYYGGCYVDIDILCNNSLDLFINQDKLNVSLFYFTKFRIMPFINNGFIACDKKNDDLLIVIKECIKRVNFTYYINEVTILYTTGPVMFSNILSKSNNVNILDETIIYETNLGEYGYNTKKGKLGCHIHELSWVNNYLLYLIKLYNIFNNNYKMIIIPILISIIIYYI